MNIKFANFAKQTSDPWKFLFHGGIIAIAFFLCHVFGGTYAIAFGASCGVLANFYSAIIRVLTIDGRQISRPALESVLEDSGYRRSPQGFFYIPGLRFLQFKSQRIEIEACGADHALYSTGPIVRRIKRKVDAFLSASS